MTDNLRSVIVFQLELDQLDKKITGTAFIQYFFQNNNIYSKYFRFFLLRSNIARCRLSNRIQLQSRIWLRGFKVSTFILLASSYTSLSIPEFSWSDIAPL